ncbi:MAG: VOC family protein [Acidimicrobiales bacterium]
MLTAVDHLVIGVVDVSEAAETYRNLGFAVTHRRDAAHVAFGDFYLEFSTGEATEASGAIRRIVLSTDDLDAEISRLESHGVPVSDPVDDPIDGPNGSLSRRSVVVDSIIPIGFVEHHHPAAERTAFVGGPAAHANTASNPERIYVAVESIDRELATFEQVLGMPAPEPEMGTVIMSLMSVFYFGNIGLAVAEPRGAGPTSDALSANGPGVFQVLCRAEHLDVAERVMVDNGVPTPSRGTRLSGESALLVDPANACGLFVALAGLP